MKDDRVYLQHIRDALDDIATYTSAGRDAFLAERMRQDATLRKLQVIGQAVKNLSDTPKSQQAHIRGSRSQVCATRSFTTISASIWISSGQSSRRTCQSCDVPLMIS